MLRSHLDTCKLYDMLLWRTGKKAPPPPPLLHQHLYTVWLSLECAEL